MNFFLITFNNANEAMKAESQCKKNNINVMMMPTPTYITKSCGICIKLDKNSMDNVTKLINENNFTYKAVYEFIDNKLKEVLRAE